MKTLYLHCGYHKTGSSFLQTLFARNRKYLQQNGTWFPFSDGEYDMISGNISAGNGPKLSSAISEFDTKKSKETLNEWLVEAEKNNCKSLLLSSEYFFHAFAKKGVLDILIDSIREVGIKHIHALVYFRDPVSHAMSTFKHRAKNGNIDDLSGWLSKDYETMDLLKKFTAYRSKYPIDWTCRKYRANSEFMAESAFVDWLGLSMPVIPNDDKVNISLNFSEIQVIQSLKHDHPNIVNYLKKELGKLSVKEKGDEKYLIEHYKKMVIQKLQKFKNLISKVNESLGKEEKLILSKPVVQEPEQNKSDMILSEYQIQAVGRALRDNFKSKKVTGKIREYSLKAVNRIKRLSFKI